MIAVGVFILIMTFVLVCVTSLGSKIDKIGDERLRVAAGSIMMVLTPLAFLPLKLFV